MTDLHTRFLYCNADINTEVREESFARNRCSSSRWDRVKPIGINTSRHSFKPESIRSSNKSNPCKTWICTNTAVLGHENRWLSKQSTDEPFFYFLSLFLVFFTYIYQLMKSIFLFIILLKGFNSIHQVKSKRIHEPCFDWVMQSREQWI